MEPTPIGQGRRIEQSDLGARTRWKNAIRTRHSACARRHAVAQSQSNGGFRPQNMKNGNFNGDPPPSVIRMLHVLDQTEARVRDAERLMAEQREAFEKLA